MEWGTKIVWWDRTGVQIVNTNTKSVWDREKKYGHIQRVGWVVGWLTGAPETQCGLGCGGGAAPGSTGRGGIGRFGDLKATFPIISRTVEVPMVCNKRWESLRISMVVRVTYGHLRRLQEH